MEALEGSLFGRQICIQWKAFSLFDSLSCLSTLAGGKFNTHNSRNIRARVTSKLIKPKKACARSKLMTLQSSIHAIQSLPYSLVIYISIFTPTMCSIKFMIRIWRGTILNLQRYIPSVFFIKVYSTFAYAYLQGLIFTQ